jgi:hypothetical protein
MPGIVGIVSQRPSEEYDALVKSMVKCLIHEPFLPMAHISPRSLASGADGLATRGRDELSQWLKEMLLDSAARSRPYLRANSLEEILKAHIKGHRNYAFEMHKILTLEFIQRKLIELN